MSKKNLAIIIIAVILIIIGILFLNRDKEDNNTVGGSQTQVDESPIAKKKTNGTYEIYNTDVNINGGSTKITATIKNVSKNKTQEQLAEIVLLDKNNNELGTIKVSIPSLESGVATEISAESLKVYNNIYDFKIK